MDYNLRQITGSNGKPRKVRALKTFTSVPRLFLVLPLFNIINGSDKLDEPIIVQKHQNTRNIEIKNAQLTIDNDFDIFLFILRKVLNSNSTSIEFTTKEMMDELHIEKVNRAQYLKTFIKSVERLSKIHVKYEERVHGEWEHTFFSFMDGKLTKTKGRIEVSKFFIEFFGNLKELYELNPEILSLLSKYQRILYVLYVCNRMSTTNYFNVDMLKERFKINSDKMPDKTFIKKIRDANNDLQELGLITGFKEIKTLDKDGKNDNPRQPTVQFDVDYTYKSLYPSISKLRAVAGLNLKAFKSTKIKILEDAAQPKKTNNEDQEWI
ncbi:replication initiation protein [Pseudomonas syringae pv. syringae]|uniref:replication initiation protein n=1 Tax=Pseudomonas syringae TaxID=317 RepID=UPI000D29602D|nr:replication initiation protein [Pseudomonas syringae]POD21217.1 hypothetical protein BKM12_07255 [Pseudomonas syringae pv. syringae]UQB20406.1 replication initiation protein [Pseudomonas syringae pv. syringae]